MEDRWFTDYQQSKRWPHYTRANADEVELLVRARATLPDQISHAIIVSRELGLLCVASIKGATTKIPDGAMIEVDGNNGRVMVKDLP